MQNKHILLLAALLVVFYGVFYYSSEATIKKYYNSLITTSNNIFSESNNNNITINEISSFIPSREFPEVVTKAKRIIENIDELKFTPSNLPISIFDGCNLPEFDPFNNDAIKVIFTKC